MSSKKPELHLRVVKREPFCTSVLSSDSTLTPASLYSFWHVLTLLTHPGLSPDTTFPNTAHIYNDNKAIPSTDITPETAKSTQMKMRREFIKDWGSGAQGEVP